MKGHGRNQENYSIKVGNWWPRTIGSECLPPPRPIYRVPQSLRAERHSDRRKRTMPGRSRQPHAGHRYGLLHSWLPELRLLPAEQHPQALMKASTAKQRIADLHATLDHLERGWNRTRRMPEGDGPGRSDCWKPGGHPPAAPDCRPRSNRGEQLLHGLPPCLAFWSPEPNSS